MLPWVGRDSAEALTGEFVLGAVLYFGCYSGLLAGYFAAVLRPQKSRGHSAVVARLCNSLVFALSSPTSSSFLILRPLLLVAMAVGFVAVVVALLSAIATVVVGRAVRCRPLCG